jgi:selenide,water dikinase
VDGFPALVADPWLNGRLTALHASSDLWASGASLRHGQALVTLPRCSEAVQQELLTQTLAGVRSVFPLIGGHTLQALEASDPRKPLAKQLSLGLVVNGQLPGGQMSWGKGPLRPGDALLLSRPIGTGVLFAAAQAGFAEPHWLTAALEVMQQSQAPLVELLAAHGCSACTDVTGFGLLGHLNEMLDASTGVDVQLQADQVPALAGSLELLEAGVASTLAPSNAAALATWPELLGIRAQLLIDPQTCGPLLAAVSEQQAGPCLAAMRSAGFAQAALIGTVQSQGPL